MRMMSMKNYKLILSVALLAVACNKGADPKKDYSDVKTVPKNDAVGETTHVLISPFTFRMISTTDLGIANFVKGKTSTYQFEISPASTIFRSARLDFKKFCPKAFLARAN